MSEEYHRSHRPFEDGPDITRLDDLFGKEVYEHPEWYGFGSDAEGQAMTRAAARVLRSLHGAPGSTPVGVFRAAPRGVTELRSGDWVTTVASYAILHGRHEEEDQDWPVYGALVPASSVRTGGSDILEWGYFGPPVPVRVVHAGGRHAETIGEYRRRVRHGDADLARAERR